MNLNRRNLLIASAASAMLAACATGTSAPPPPIVFVHGNGDTAALWTTTLWRFESNGWPRERLRAIDIPYPLSREDDTKPQDGRSSTAENMAYLSAEVDKLLMATGASQVVLIANSRGGNAVRNYLQNGSGAGKVSHAILCGTPNHGVYADPKRAPNAEFNGAGAFLTRLNAPGSSEASTPPATISAPSALPSRMPASTPPASRPLRKRCRAATSSTARRSGPRPRRSPTRSCC